MTFKEVAPSKIAEIARELVEGLPEAIGCGEALVEDWAVWLAVSGEGVIIRASCDGSEKMIVIHGFDDTITLAAQKKAPDMMTEMVIRKSQVTSIHGSTECQWILADLKSLHATLIN
jgi:hypothetical protein